jgi:predicted metalloprotease
MQIRSRPVVAAIAAVVAVAVALVLALVTGGGHGDRSFGYSDPFDRFPSGGRAGSAGEVEGAPAERRLAERLRFVTADAQTFWAQRFERAGRPYTPARVVVFEGSVPTACGPATAAVGPFYCPLDQSVYLDLGFFRQLAVEFHAPGDFAQAYVLAHELGHHVQNLTGIVAQVQRAVAERRAPFHLLSIRQELQADCLAGVWGHSTYERGIADNGDLDEALRAAAAVGDDRVQKRLSGRIDPETWTHGSAEQRRHWLLKGLLSGDPNACDTFSATRL